MRSSGSRHHSRSAKLSARLDFTASNTLTLPTFSHDNLRELYLFVDSEFKESAYGDGPFLTSLPMLALPLGVLQGFPKLLQILLFCPHFISLYIANTDSKDMKMS